MDWVRRAFGASQPPMDQRAPTEHHAVVAAILRQESGAAEVLLIRRSEDERDPWSGHMALPGGHADPGDVDLLHTALREVTEEIGIDLVRDATLLGRLPGTGAVARGRHLDFTIFPLVFALERHVAPALNPLEVKEIVWANLQQLLTGAAESSISYSIDATPQRFPAFDVQGHRVWGLTYRILQNLLGVLRGGFPSAPPST